MTVRESEADFTTFVLDTAERLGWTGYHDTDPRRDTAGWPDWVFRHEPERCPAHCDQQAVIFVELKSARGQLSRAQQRWMDALNRTGCSARVWRPTDRGLVLQALDLHGLGWKVSA